MPEDLLGENFTIILPTYNESGNILKMIEHLRTSHPDTSILIMDDNSPDGTGSKVIEAYGDDEHVKLVIRRNVQKGLSASVIEGIEQTSTKFFLVMDSDFQHPPEIIPVVMGKMTTGADLCVGVRINRNALGTKKKTFFPGS